MPGKLHPCSLCSKVFPTFQKLNNHLRVHTGERPFKCDVCSKRFTQSCNLEIHKRTHSGLKPFECEVCKKAFSHKSNLKTHENIHKGVKPFQCTICWKCFGRPESLHAHKMTHSITERKLECEDCGKRLYQELKNSCEGPPYPCKLCGNDFQNLYGLHSHMKHHIGPLTDKCLDCGNALFVKLRGPSGESLYQAGLMTDCLFCEERLPQKDLESHMRSHTREWEELQFPLVNTDLA